MFVLCSSSLHGIFDDFEAESFLEYVNPDLKSVSQAMKAAISSVDAIRKLRFNIASGAEIYDWKNITERLFQKIIDITEKKFKD